MNEGGKEEERRWAVNGLGLKIEIEKKRKGKEEERAWKKKREK